MSLSVWLELGMYLSHITQKPWQVNVTRSVPNEVPNLACKKSPSFLSRSISKCLNFTFCCTFEPFLVMFTMEKVGKTYWYILHYAGKVSVYRIPYSRLYYVNVRQLKWRQERDAWVFSIVQIGVKPDHNKLCTQK